MKKVTNIYLDDEDYDLLSNTKEIIDEIIELIDGDGLLKIHTSVINTYIDLNFLIELGKNIDLLKKVSFEVVKNENN